MTARLHLVTDDAVLRRPDFLAVAGETLRAGGPALAFHVRGPATTGSELLEFTRQTADLASAAGAALVVNDRVDIALALGVRRVHLGQRSLPARTARGLFEPDAVIGVSVHDRDEASAAADEGADYLMVGTMFATPSHPDGAPEGPGLLRLVRRVTAVPLVAVGGITPQRVEAVVEAGAAGVAVVSGVWRSERPAGAVEVYLRALAGAMGDATTDSGA